MQAFGPEEFRKIDSVLDRVYGGSPEENRRPHLQQSLHSRMRSTRRSDIDTYLAFLAVDTTEQGALAAMLTVGETYFFRHDQHFDAVRDVVLPDLIRSGRKRIRMLSAACASGEEPYSLAMVAAQSHLLPAMDIVGIDVNPAAIEKANAAAYTEWSLRSTTPAQRDRFFKPEGKKIWKLNEDIRKSVSFQLGNLMTLAPENFTVGKDGEHGFDVVFCRNALIYFKHEAIIEVVHRLCALLRPGGFLFLGPTETLRGISRSFQLCHTNGTFYYRLHHCEDVPDFRASPKIIGQVGDTPYIVPPTFTDIPIPVLNTSIDTAWFDEIQRSSDRVASLTAKPRAATSKRKLTRERTLADVLALVEGDDLSGALEMFEQLSESERQFQQTRVLKAALLMQTGGRDEAMSLASEALRNDELNAEAHYLMSLALEETSPAESREHAERAAYLAKDFAMAQVRLGMLQARDNPTAAQATFKQAAEAIGKDDRRRLALFGGGFSPAGLRAVCEAESRALDRRR